MKSDVISKNPDRADEPLTDEEFERGRTALLARRARAATGLSQHLFAARYGFSRASVRDWEQGRRVPARAVRSYLRVVAKMPDQIADALNEPA
ncbi:MAG: helix-turn-helix domain-containing protein [Geminicoccaceae bacterium]